MRDTRTDPQVIAAWAELDKAMKHAGHVRLISRHGSLHPAEYATADEAWEHSLIDIGVAAIVLREAIADCMRDEPHDDGPEDA